MLPPKKLQATEWEEGAEGHKDRPIGVFRGVGEGKGMPNRRVGGGCLWASSPRAGQAVCQLLKSVVMETKPSN